MKPATSAQEADYPTAENPITLKLGHVGPPASSLQIAAETMADEIKEATGGAVLLKCIRQSQLGDAVVMLDGLSNGTLEMAMVGCNEIATMLPDFYAFCLPFLFSDIDEFINVARDPEVSAKANEIMNSKGITLIGILLWRIPRLLQYPAHRPHSRRYCWSEGPHPGRHHLRRYL